MILNVNKAKDLAFPTMSFVFGRDSQLGVRYFAYEFIWESGIRDSEDRPKFPFALLLTPFMALALNLFMLYCLHLQTRDADTDLFFMSIVRINESLSKSRNRNNEIAIIVSL